MICCKKGFVFHHLNRLVFEICLYKIDMEKSLCHLFQLTNLLSLHMSFSKIFDFELFCMLLENIYQQKGSQAYIHSWNPLYFSVFYILSIPYWNFYDYIGNWYITVSCYIHHGSLHHTYHIDFCFCMWYSPMTIRKA